MADEENPFGSGGPFGVGPFGPLVAAAVVAVGGINAGASVTTSVPRTKTLHYQAKVFVAAPDEVLNPPPPATAESFTITTGQNFRRTLHYQAKVEPLRPPEVAAVVVADIAWHAPFSAPPPRTLVLQRQQYQPFVPPVAPQVTTAAWLQPFQRQVAGPFPVHTQPVLGFAAAPQPTPDEWLQPFQRAVPPPPVRHTQPISGYQPEVVVSNLTTTLEWLQPFQKAVPPPHPAISQPVFGYPYEAVVVSNTTTTLEWMGAWQGAKPSRPVHTQPVHAHLLPNLTTTLEWQIAWQKAVPTPPVRHTQPVFGYPYPSIENTIAGLGWFYRFERAVPAQPVRHTQPVLGTPPEPPVTPDKWLQPFQKAVATPPARHTQPDRGYPPVAVANIRTEWDWSIQWQGPPRTLQRLAAGAGFSLPPSNYRNEWDWPLAWNLAAKAPKPVHTQPVFGYPYVTVQNTITGIAWLYRFEKAVPVPPVRHTQPFFGYPYVATPPPSNLTTTLEWQQRWQGPPRTLQQLAAGPVLPPRATPTIANTITGIAWLQAWKGPPRYWPIKVQQTPFIPKEFVQDRITPDKWLLAFQKAAPRQPVWHAQPPFVYSPPAPVTLTTTFEWQQPLSVAVKSPPVRPTQPRFGLAPPPEVVVVDSGINAGVSVTWSFNSTKTLFYQSWAFAYAPIPEVIVPPEPPPPTVQPKHAHGQISTPGGRTRIAPVAGTCDPAFQSSSYQSSFQTCEGSGPVTSRGGIRTSMRIHTSSRWQRARTTIRTGTRCVPAFEAEAYQEDAFATCSDTPAAKGSTTTKDDP